MSGSVACIGECMIELSDLGGGEMRQAFGGDTLNTAVYLARSGVPVDYVTALGDDAYSEAMLAAWRDEGVGTGHVARLPGRLPGLYVIRTDEAGERSFLYWRSAAAARELARACDLAAALKGRAVAFTSGITLSILDEASRDALIGALQAARAAGTRIAFDGNYRPRGWPGPEAAAEAMARVLAIADIALPSADDERTLHGDADAAATARRLAGQGVAEVAVKDAARGCVIAADSDLETVPVEQDVEPVDTTAAGDAFNAGYLAARLAGETPAAAARRGHALAAIVIQHRGALVPREAMC